MHLFFKSTKWDSEKAFFRATVIIKWDNEYKICINYKTSNKYKVLLISLAEKKSNVYFYFFNHHYHLTSFYSLWNLGVIFKSKHCISFKHFSLSLCQRSMNPVVCSLPLHLFLPPHSLLVWFSRGFKYLQNTASFSVM